MASRKPAPARVIEAGAVETEQYREEPIVEAASVTPFPMQDVPSAPQEADLSGPEVAEIRLRNDAVDRAGKDAEAARLTFIQSQRLAQYGQEALTGLIRELIKIKGLDPTMRYRIDIDRGRIVATTGQ